jgi:hypothetical protein
MCFFRMPEAPKPAPLPRVPQPDSDLVMRRGDEARRIAAMSGGASANIVSDLRASDIAAARPVLSPAKAVFLGQ